jgi:hypothetical protein
MEKPLMHGLWRDDPKSKINGHFKSHHITVRDLEF